MNVRLLSLQALHYLMIHIVIALDEYCEVHGMNPSPPVVLEVGHSPVPGHSHVPNPDDTWMMSTSRELLTSTQTIKAHRPTNTFNNHNDQEHDKMFRIPLLRNR